MRFLLIEDDEVDAEAFTRAFHRYLKHSLQVVSDAEIALTLLRGDDTQAPLTWPYVIILDLGLPRLNGLEFLEMLRQDPQLRRSVVFVLTASPYAVNQQIAYRHGIAGYILKDALLNDSQRLFVFFAMYCRLNTFST